MDVLSWGTKFPGTVDEAWARAIDQPIMLEGFPTKLRMPASKFNRC